MNSETEQALTTILKVGAQMLITGPSGDIDEWKLPKSTPITVKRKIVEEMDKWNEVQRLRAIELKKAYDVLANTLKNKKFNHEKNRI